MNLDLNNVQMFQINNDMVIGKWVLQVIFNSAIGVYDNAFFCVSVILVVNFNKNFNNNSLKGFQPSRLSSFKE